MRRARALGVAITVAAAWCGCHTPAPGSAPQPSAGSTPRASVNASATVPPHALRPRSWHLRPDSPFGVVGEGLPWRTLVEQLNGVTLILTDRCGAAPSTLDLPTFPQQLRAVEGDTFAPKQWLGVPPPGRPKAKSSLQGHWQDLWLIYEYGAGDDGPSEVLHLVGSTWQVVPRAQPDDADDELEPHQIFDWFDGAKLVAQTPRHTHTSAERVAPFLVWGRTAHAPPDFAKLYFPRDSFQEVQETTVNYAMLPTRELFAGHGLYLTHSHRSIVTIARSKRSGEVSVETAIDSLGAWSGPTFATGRLNGKDTVVAWADAIDAGNPRHWLHAYDSDSSVDIAPPDPRLAHHGPTEVWLAAEKLWASRDSVVWRFDGHSWSKFASLRKHTRFSIVTEDGSLWQIDGLDLNHFDTEGHKHIVPLFTDANPDWILSSVLAVAPDNVWLTLSNATETVLLRTKGMASVLTCP